MSRPSPQPRSVLKNLAAYRPDLTSKSTAVPRLRLSVNEGALGPSPKAMAALTALTGDIHRYPDQISGALTQAIADASGLDGKRILPSNGSDELIQLLASAYIHHGDEAIITQYGFLVFRQAIQVMGGTVVVAEDNDLTVSVAAILAAVTDKTKLIFLANPNNPTGTMVTRADIARLIAELPSHIVLVLDGAYAEYCAHIADYSDGAEFVDQHSNVVMLRTFSKLFGLAGLRLGWGYMPQDIYEVLANIRPAFSVNAAAAVAGAAAVQDKAFIAKSLTHNRRWLQQMHQSLTQAGFTPLPSVTNFFLLRFADAAQADAAHLFLADRGIVLRRMAAYGLADCLRMSIGTDAEMAEVMTVFKDLANHLQGTNP